MLCWVEENCPENLNWECVMFVAVIDWTDPSSSPWQWINLTVGFLGLVLTWIAASRAKAAKTAAQAARKSASMLARHDRFQELQLEFQDLQLLVSNNSSAELLGTKCSRLVSATMRFKTEATAELGDASRENLDIIREQLREMGNTVFNPKIAEGTRRARFQIALDAMAGAIGVVAANLGRALLENQNDN